MELLLKIALASANQLQRLISKTEDVFIKTSHTVSVSVVVCKNIYHTMTSPLH